MTAIPREYRAPLKSRDAIVDFLSDHYSYYSTGGNTSPLAWNVKCSGVDLSFEHLLDLYREDEGDPAYTHFPEWLGPVQALYDEHKESLFDWGIEDASGFVTEDGYYHCLWDGTELDVKFGWAGKSGGYIVLLNFEGHKLEGVSKAEFIDDLLDNSIWDYVDLRRLYRFVVMLDHDWRRTAVEHHVECCTAFTFFGHVCANVPRVEMTQRLLQLA